MGPAKQSRFQIPRRPRLKMPDDELPYLTIRQIQQTKRTPVEYKALQPKEQVLEVVPGHDTVP